MNAAGSLTIDSRALFQVSNAAKEGPVSTGRPSRPRALVAGDVLAGKYELVGILGSGGMGMVWRAHSLAFDVDVAVKMLRPENGDEVAAERLLREARAMAKLGHPAIVRPLDFGKTDAGEPFLVMELLSGGSLAEWLDRRGRMSASQAVQMLLPIADGLVAAHAQGIVHRDIKPENILAVPDRAGTYLPKLVDFGIAKVERQGVITEEGAVLGSLQYMSPEQADGRPVGEQSDVWSLCVVLYELVTGRRPFEGQTLSEILIALHTKPPVPTSQLAAGDDELWEIIERGLRKPLAERWPTVRSLGRALATWAIERGTTTDATGASLEHHWLDRGSDAFALVPSLIGAVGANGTPSSPRAWSVSMTQLSPFVPAPETHRSGRTGSITLPAPVSVRRVTTRTRPRRLRVIAAVFALVVVPVLGMAGLHAHDATAAASAPPVALAIPVHAAAPALPVLAAELTTLPPVSTTPAPAATPATSARAGRLAPLGKQKLAAAPMPLPAAPNF